MGANDGVGAWATREKGHAALWSRLIIHFWALEAEAYVRGQAGGEDGVKEKEGEGEDGKGVNPVVFLSRAFENTKRATAEPNEWFGTTTASGSTHHERAQKCLCVRLPIVSLW